MGQRRSIWMGDHRFASDGAGRYYSTCGKYVMFHSCKSEKDIAQWELYRINAEKLPTELVDYGIGMGDILTHFKRGDFTLEVSR